MGPIGTLYGALKSSRSSPVNAISNLLAQGPLTTRLVMGLTGMLLPIQAPIIDVPVPNCGRASRAGIGVTAYLVSLV